MDVSFAPKIQHWDFVRRGVFRWNTDRCNGSLCLFKVYKESQHILLQPYFQFPILFYLELIEKQLSNRTKVIDITLTIDQKG